ncbi:MAG: hypothetical protein ACREMX_14440 [Gemmatimonadales bacterium]
MRSFRSSRAGWCAAVALLLAACSIVPRSTEPQPAQIRVLGYSHNGSDVDVYLLCGDRDARWLGVVSKKGVAAFEFPAAVGRCVSGLNFFLVSRDRGRGYWAGPVRPQRGGYIDLVIEKYAGLSTARVRNDLR